jgi:hypothetical protein
MLKYLTNTAYGLVESAGKVAGYALNQTAHGVVNCVQSPINYLAQTLNGYSKITLCATVGVKLTAHLYESGILDSCFTGGYSSYIYHGVGGLAKSAQNTEIVNDLLNTGIKLSCAVTYGLPFVNASLNGLHFGIDKVIPSYKNEIEPLVAAHYEDTQTPAARLEHQLGRMNDLLEYRLLAEHNQDEIGGYIEYNK